MLDVGSGAGDTAFLLAELVGPPMDHWGGSICSSIAVARQRANERSLRNVAFVEADPSTMTFEQPFDAVVGRYVLMFQTDPIPMLSKLKALIRPDGIVVFHRVDPNGARSEPPVPLYTDCATGWRMRKAEAGPMSGWASNCIAHSSPLGWPLDDAAALGYRWRGECLRPSVCKSRSGDDVDRPNGTPRPCNGGRSGHQITSGTGHQGNHNEPERDCGPRGNRCVSRFKCVAPDLGPLLLERRGNVGRCVPPQPATTAIRSIAVCSSTPNRTAEIDPLKLAFVVMRPQPEGAMSETRKLAAILVADVVGYSRLIGADEDRILARLRALRSDLIDPTIAVHHGRVFEAQRRWRNCRVPKCRRRALLRH